MELEKIREIVEGIKALDIGLDEAFSLGVITSKEYSKVEKCFDPEVMLFCLESRNFCLVPELRGASGKRGKDFYYSSNFKEVFHSLYMGNEVPGHNLEEPTGVCQCGAPYWGEKNGKEVHGYEARGREHNLAVVRRALDIISIPGEHWRLERRHRVLVNMRIARRGEVRRVDHSQGGWTESDGSVFSPGWSKSGGSRSYESWVEDKEAAARWLAELECELKKIDEM